MRQILIVVSLLIGLTSFAAEPDKALLPWDTEWKTAFERARVEKKLVFVDYYADWCGPCREMDRRVFPREDVQRYLASFVLLRIDVETKEGAAQMKRVGVIPTYIVFDPGERERLRFSGAMTAQRFVAALEEVVQTSSGFLTAGELTDKGKKSEGALYAGNAYLRLQMASKARESYQIAIKEATAIGDAVAGKVARSQHAYSWAIDKNPKRAVKELKPLTLEVAGPDADALTWLLLGRAAEKARDFPAAREAYGNAIAAGPTAALVKQAQDALAELGP